MDRRVKVFKSELDKTTRSAVQTELYEGWFEGYGVDWVWQPDQYVQVTTAIVRREDGRVSMIYLPLIQFVG